MLIESLDLKELVILHPERKCCGVGGKKKILTYHSYHLC